MSHCPYCSESLSDTQTPAGTAGLAACRACYNPVLVTWRDGNAVYGPVPGSRDVRQIAAPGSIAADLLAQLPAALDDLPVLPEISQRILRLLKDPEFGMPELAATVREDQVLALAIMKQANSVAYGGLHQIKDINSACARLGMKTVANTVQLVANRNLFITGNAQLRGSMERLWRHSVATAHCCNEIARLTLAPDPETSFLAGLIHDVGKVLLLEMIANPRTRVLRDLEGNPELIREVLASVHPLFGLLVCQEWRLPQEINAATYFHHRPEQCPVTDWLGIVHTTALANTIARVEGFGLYPGTEEAFLASDPSTIYLGLSDIKLATLRVDFSDALEALFEAAG